MAYISFQPSDYFNTKLYTGTDSSNAITGVGFQPDWVWLKKRSGVASHALMDAVRGNDKSLRSNTTGAEYTNTYFSSFDSDGFTVATSESDVNASGATYVSWNWKANGAGSSNSDGSTSSTVSASTTSGFSIVKYTNPSSGSPFTVGHGLGAKPTLVITKKLNGTQTWGVYHIGSGFGKYLRLDDTAVEASANLVTATSTTTYSTYKDHHDTGDEIIAYCFAPIKGFSAIGSYTGNGEPSQNAPFIYTGFKPAFLLVKSSTFAEPWFINDSKRSPTGGTNPNSYYMRPNTTEAEGTSTGNSIDLMSNGFKLQNNDNAYNKNGQTYIYLAIAEHSLVSSNGVPTTAR